MTRENEVKFQVSDPDLIEQRAKDLGCVLESETEQVDRYFDYPSFVLSRHLHGLRIREFHGAPQSCDFKVLFYFPERPNDPWYVDENVSDFPVSRECLVSIFKRLGISNRSIGEELDPIELEKVLLGEKLVEAFRITKTRRKYACPEGMQILFDYVKELGSFVELEGSHCQAYLSSLGLPEDGRLKRWGYTSLLLESKGIFNQGNFKPQFERSPMWNVLPDEVTLYNAIKGGIVDPSQRRSQPHLQTF
ncbi:class IV adenylate cyclase [archaeon]|jgi:adenylate cyclase class IV|nr:class IV adenylate cyclase [archaeon]MBT4416784.1 class IV adenylate cyclase [archaeon]